MKIIFSFLSFHREITFCHLTIHLTFCKISVALLNNILRSLCSTQFKAERLNKKKSFSFKDKTKDNWLKAYLWVWLVSGSLGKIWDWWSSCLPHSEGTHYSGFDTLLDCTIKSPSWAWFVSSDQATKISDGKLFFEFSYLSFSR